jgi:hypothetical protein
VNWEVMFRGLMGVSFVLAVVLLSCAGGSAGVGENSEARLFFGSSIAAAILGCVFLGLSA